ncbi:MAG: T9SS type A sorting domain-containing protein, partial [candidate division Zixibacteria bacterium]|nr:T9SS type A sorting domain-containing protein [candidate division Zixibacteria bacterium]
TPPYTGAWSSENSPYTITFVASDGDTSSAEDVLINVINKDPDAKDYVLEIGADTGLFSEIVTVPIKLTNPDSVEGMKLLINYDPSALWLLEVNRSNTRISDWAYFESKVGIPELGDITILAQVEKASYVEDSPKPLVTPPMSPGSGVITNLIFKVMLDPYYYDLDLITDVKFKFTDSTDNTLNGSTDEEFIGQNEIEYKDGYILIKMSDVVLGDINLNGIPFEVGDAVVFSNFLIDPINNPLNLQQELNSDVNQDGICCSLADFLALLRQILEGGSYVFKKESITSNTVQLNVKRNSTSLDFYIDSDVPVGGVMLTIGHPWIEFEAPILSPEASGMALLKKEYGEELRLLIYNTTTQYIEPGQRKLLTIPVVKGEGDIVFHKAFFSDNMGNLMDANITMEAEKEVPRRFSLLQNNPNPFNPQTTISFALPEEGEVSLIIYNLKGQLVKVMVNQRLESGLHTFICDGKDNSGKDLPSGIYFYKLTAGKYSKAKKMIKIK